MFDLLNARPVEKEKVELVKPNEIKILEKGESEDSKGTIYTIEKSADKYLYKQLGIRSSMSKDLYKLYEDMWKDLINRQLSEKDGKPAPFQFTDPDLRYVVDNDYSLIDAGILNDEYYDEFKKKLETFIMEINSLEHTRKFYIEGSGGLIKLVLYRADADIAEDDYTPVVILEVNNKKAEYSVYTGILIYKSFTFIPSMNPIMTAQSYIEFIMNLNLLGSLELSEDSAGDLYNSYLDFKSGHMEISARELIRILNKVGCKLELNEDLSLADIQNLRNEGSNTTLKEFFNTFRLTTGETAEDILNLSEVKKIFRYNKLTIVDLLEILSKEYLEETGAKITAQILSDLVFGLYTKKTDSVDAEGIIKDINNK